IHVAGRYAAAGSLPAPRTHEHLGDLCAGHVRVGPEGAVAVTGDQVARRGGLDIAVERVLEANVAEGRLGRGDQTPALREHEHLHQLRSRGRVLRPEAAVAVPGDDALAGQLLDVRVGPVIGR